MADLLPTDVLLVNRAGVDYSIPQSDVMADVLDTDLILVNRAGVDYQTSYADVKKGFGPDKINPAPTDWTTGAAVTGGTGTQADPFILAAGTATPAGAKIQSGDIGTLTGLKDNDLIEWTVKAGGDRFKQSLALVPASGAVAFDLTYTDTPASTTGQVYNGEFQIGTTFFKWDVTQITGAIDKPAITAPADGAGEVVQAISGTIAAVQEDSPNAGETTLTFATDKDLAKFKALDVVQMDSAGSPETSEITKVILPTGIAYSKGLTVSGVGFNNSPTAGFSRTPGSVVSTSNNAAITWTINKAWGLTGPLTINPGNFAYRYSINGASFSADLPKNTFTNLGNITTMTTFAIERWIDSETPGTMLTKWSMGDSDGSGAVIRLNGLPLYGAPETTVLELTNDTNLANLRIGDEVKTGVPIAAIDEAAPSVTVDGGTWATGDTVTGPSFSASGTVASVDVAAKTMTLSASTGRWLATHASYEAGKRLDKFVKGAPTLSAGAAPDVTLITFVSSAYATTPVGAAATMPHFSTDWEVYAKADTAHATLVFGATADQTNLTSWPGAQNQLTADTAYRARIRYHAASADSPWSDDITFKTKA